MSLLELYWVKPAATDPLSADRRSTELLWGSTAYMVTRKVDAL